MIGSTIANFHLELGLLWK